MIEYFTQLPAILKWVMVLVTAIIVAVFYAVSHGRTIKYFGSSLEIGAPSSKGKSNDSQDGRNLQNDLSWADIHKSVDVVYDQMRNNKYEPKYIVCMGRGGAIVGVLLSQKYNKIPPIPIITMTMKHGISRDSEDQSIRYRIDGVEDICSVKEYLNDVLLVSTDTISGTALRVGREALKSRDVQVTATACLYKMEDSASIPTYYSEICSKRYVYPWMESSFNDVWGI